MFIWTDSLFPGFALALLSFSDLDFSMVQLAGIMSFSGAHKAGEFRRIGFRFFRIELGFFRIWIWVFQDLVFGLFQDSDLGFSGFGVWSFSGSGYTWFFRIRLGFSGSGSGFFRIWRLVFSRIPDFGSLWIWILGFSDRIVFVC